MSFFRYGTVYWVDMANLSHTHPWVHEQLATPGSWTYQRQGINGYNGLAADQTIETTINRESKSAGGVVGITKKRGMCSFINVFMTQSGLVGTSTM